MCLHSLTRFGKGRSGTGVQSMLSVVEDGKWADRLSLSVGLVGVWLRLANTLIRFSWGPFYSPSWSSLKLACIE